MSTHRSLNKLEFKAHMSIHNFVEVPEGEVHESVGHTRDRLGKKHLLVDEEGKSRIGDLRKKIAGLALFFVVVLAGAALADSLPEEGIVKKKGPNASVSSADADTRSISSWMNKDDSSKPPSSQIGSNSVSLSDDGAPNVSTRF